MTRQRRNRSAQFLARKQAGTRRLLTIRGAMQPGFLWSAICSGCPNWGIDHATYTEYQAGVRLHQIIHARQGQVTTT
ncbi:MAG: hypothetical protein WC054_12935 [Candidatus Nanopelagicales bacterium]